MSTINDVIDFAEARRPGIKRGLIPATEHDIARYAKLSGGPIPRRYEEMLRLMGMSCGELTLADAELDIQQLNARYFAFEPKHDKRYALVAIDRGEMYLDYYIDRAGGDAEDGPVVRFDYEVADPEIFVSYGSLYEWLYSGVFNDLAVKQRAFASEKVLSTDDPEQMLLKIRAALTRLGFVAPLDETPLLSAVNRVDASVIARQHPTDEFIALGVGADDRGEMIRIRELLIDAVGR